MTVEKPKPKQLLRRITTGTNSTMNQSQFLAITCNSFEAREKSRVHAIGFGFASHWLKNWRESSKPITKQSQSRNYFRQSFENCSNYLQSWTYLPYSIKKMPCVAKRGSPSSELARSVQKQVCNS